MTKPILSTDGKRQPRALVVALRRIAKDPRATVTQRLRACELQAIIAGYIEGRKESESGAPRDGNGKRESEIRSFPPSKRLRDLYDRTFPQESEKGSPGGAEGTRLESSGGDAEP
jgi:hypothetical protein